MVEECILRVMKCYKISTPDQKAAFFRKHYVCSMDFDVAFGDLDASILSDMKFLDRRI